MDKTRQSGSLNPNNVPVILVPWLSVIEKYGPNDVEGRSSDRIFEWLKADRKERDRLEEDMAKWTLAEHDAYLQWRRDDVESPEGWQFNCFFHILDTFQIRTGAYQSDPVERGIHSLRLATGDSDDAARMRCASISGLLWYGEFARPALPLVKALLNDEDDRVRAIANVFVAELEGNREYHEAEIKKIIDSQPPLDPDLTQVERIRAELTRGDIPGSLEYLRRSDREKNVTGFRAALRDGHLPRIRQLLPKIDRREFDGELNDMLLSVASKGHAECARILLDWGAPADYFEERLGMPLIHSVAARPRCEEMLKVLIEFGANPDRLDSEGRTAAGVAVEFGRHEYLPILNPKGTSTC